MFSAIYLLEIVINIVDSVMLIKVHHLNNKEGN